MEEGDLGDDTSETKPMGEMGQPDCEEGEEDEAQSEIDPADECDLDEFGDVRGGTYAREASGAEGDGEVDGSGE